MMEVVIIILSIVLSILFFHWFRDVSVLLKLVDKQKRLNSSMKIYFNLLGYSPIKNKYYRMVAFILFASTFLVTAKLTDQLIGCNKEEIRTKTIVGMMLGDKLIKARLSQGLLILALSMYILCDGLGLILANEFFVLALALFVFCINMDVKLTKKRVLNGTYGDNEFESREIIKYILSHSNPDDFNDSGGFKKIIEDIDLEELVSGPECGAKI